MRTGSVIDKLLIEIEHGLRTCFVKPPPGPRSYPASEKAHDQSEDQQNQHITGLMRVNNSGEVAAQGLYRGQAVTARHHLVHQNLLVAAEDENEHLNWCQTRLQELGGRRSLLDPFWYAGSFAIGFTAGTIGDRWSLGFVEETEKQVTVHLQDHLNRLPEDDERSQSILRQMQQDEIQHAVNARDAGAAELPPPIKAAMKMTSKIMTTLAYRL
jgi:ubiquinone biosynthesis monooxygenase Coq7